MINLFVVGFPREMDEMELSEMFAYHGIVETIRIVRDKETNISKGYAFIGISDQAAADRIIKALDGISIGNRTMSVRIANESQ